MRSISSSKSRRQRSRSTLRPAVTARSSVVHTPSDHRGGGRTTSTVTFRAVTKCRWSTKQRCATLAEALKRYHETACPEYDETLRDVIGRVATAGSFGKTDLGALFFWKRIPTGAWAEELLCMSDSDVRRITAAPSPPPAIST
jgi:hypothetical protein